MSVRNTIRALPTLAKVGFAEAVAYRAEMLVWILSTTMPLVMMALWTAVAQEAPVGRYGQPQFVAYFLATFIVRQLTGAWVAWELNYEVRQGTLSMRLLRPIHPLWHFAVDNLAALPMRLVLAIPVAFIALWVVGAKYLTHDARVWLIWLPAMLGAWLITYLANVVTGALCFFVEQSTKVMEIWLAAFFVFSGYLIPIDLFPHWLRTVADWLPFRYQMGFPVELMTAAYGPGHALVMLGRQWAYVGVMWIFAALMWRAGLRRYEAYGG